MLNLPVTYIKITKGNLWNNRPTKRDHMKKKEYYKESYMTYSINCSKTLPCYTAILSALFDRIKIAQNQFTRPRAFHVRFRLKDGIGSRTVTDRLNKYYGLKRKGRLAVNTFKPLWVRASELDPDQDGYHSHLAIILEGKKAEKAGLDGFFAKLKSEGLLENYQVVPPYDLKYKNGVDLKTEEGVAYYFRWISYIAKTRSKEFIGQTYNSNRLKRSA